MAAQPVLVVAERELQGQTRPRAAGELVADAQLQQSDDDVRLGGAVGKVHRARHRAPHALASARGRRQRGHVDAGDPLPRARHHARRVVGHGAGALGVRGLGERPERSDGAERCVARDTMEGGAAVRGHALSRTRDAVREPMT